jgi:hypothetical protein
MWCTSAAERRYLIRTVIATALYIVAMLAVSWTFAHRHPQGVWVYVLALLPALPIFAVIAILGIYLVEETDEFVRTILVQSSLWATAAVLAFSTCWSLLQTYVHSINRGAGLAGYWVYILWWMAFGLAQPLVRWRYK